MQRYRRFVAVTAEPSGALATVACHLRLVKGRAGRMVERAHARQRLCVVYRCMVAEGVAEEAEGRTKVVTRPPCVRARLPLTACWFRSVSSNPASSFLVAYMSRASTSHGEAREQSTLSTFFPQQPSPVKRPGKKRATSPIDLTLDSGDEAPPPPKRTKASAETTSRFFSQRDANRDVLGTSLPTPTGVGEHWRFQPASPQQPATAAGHPIDPKEQAQRKKLREAFSKKLLGPNNPFARGDDEIEGTISESSDSEPASPIPKAAKRAKATKPPPENGSGSDSDPQFKALMETFTNTSKGRGKGKAPARAKKQKVVELGPSGKPWTPLEMQVCLLLLHRATNIADGLYSRYLS